MKAHIGIAGSIRCECGNYLMAGNTSDGEQDMLICFNMQCEHNGVRFKVPTVELEPA